MHIYPLLTRSRLRLSFSLSPLLSSWNFGKILIQYVSQSVTPVPQRTVDDRVENATAHSRPYRE